MTVDSRLSATKKKRLVAHIVHREPDTLGLACDDDRESCLEMDSLRPVRESLLFLVDAVIADGQCLARVGRR